MREHEANASLNVKAKPDTLWLTNQDLIPIFSDEAHVLRLRTEEVLFKNGDPSVEALTPRSATISASVSALTMGGGAISV